MCTFTVLLEEAVKIISVRMFECLQRQIFAIPSHLYHLQGKTTKFNHSSRNVDQTAALKGTGAPGGLCGYKKPLHRIMYRGFADLLGR